MGTPSSQGLGKAGHQPSAFALGASEAVENEELDTGMQRGQNTRLGPGQAVLVEPAASCPMATRLPNLVAIARAKVDDLDGAGVPRIGPIRQLNKPSEPRASPGQRRGDIEEQTVDIVALREPNSRNCEAVRLHFSIQWSAGNFFRPCRPEVNRGG